MCNHMQLNIYFPYCCMQKETGILLGYYHNERNSYVVVSVCPMGQDQSIQKTDCSDGLRNAQALGYWLPGHDASTTKKVSSLIKLQKSWLIIRHCAGTFEVSYSRSKLRRRPLSHGTFYGQSVIVLYRICDIFNGRDRLQIQKEYLDQLQFNQLQARIKGCSKISSIEGNDPCSLFRGKTDLEMVHYVFCKVVDYQLNIELQSKPCHDSSFQYFSYTSWISLPIWNFVTSFLAVLSNACCIVLNLFKCQILQKILCFSSLSSHFNFKAKLLLKLQQPLHATPFCKRDIVLAFLIDGIIGWLFCYWVVSLHSCVWTHISKILMPSVDLIGKEVEALIRWLMGIPIGLKLNSPLNHFLGKFFLHHVRLWLEYIQTLLLTFAPEHSNISWPLYLSCLGFSFFIAFISDLVSLLTFHVYCFYVYATRLYGLQIAGLMSLWRLFRGKKWNPLRQRVDTLTHPPDVANHRFFTGTLLFTILLFLLPTTALYYAIFALLRSVTITLQYMLHTLRKYLSCFPWYSLGVRYARPCAFATAARFNRTAMRGQNKQDWTSATDLSEGHNIEVVTSVTILEMVFDVKGYKTVIKEKLENASNSLTRPTPLHSFLTNLMTGKLM